jgi:YYY domain-containing protein
LPDRGYAFAKPAGLLLVGWLTWWLASVKVLPFSASTIALAILALGLSSAALAAWQRAALLGWLRANLKLLLAEEAVFWGAFFLVLAVRWANPDLWHPSLGGEKPMDFAFLNAVVKSTYFPPYDPWFAGGYINYYYFGLALVATLVKLTGILPAVAYNLAIPTFFAFLASAAFGATLGLTPTGPSHRPIGRRALGLSLLAVVLIAVAGNLGELRVLIPQIAGAVSGHASVLPIQAWYWDATRLIQHPFSEPGPITEFPWFSFLYADLHAHLLALPYTLLVLALSIGLIREPARPVGPFHRVLGLVPLAFVLGALWPLNPWDFPTYAVVALGALLLASWRRYATPLRSLLNAFGNWVVVGVLAYLLFLPFHLLYVSPFVGLERWKGSVTPLADYLTIHGLFLFLIVAALMVDFWFGTDLNPSARLIRLGIRRWRQLPRLLHLHRVMVSGSRLYRVGLCLTAVGCLLAIGLVLSRMPVLALIVGLGTLATLLAVRGRSASAEGPMAVRQRLWQMTLVLVIAGLIITLAAEMIVPTGIDIGRMNTVFKLYLQAWVVWGLAAVAAVGVVARCFSRLPAIGRVMWSTAFAALLSGALLYPLLATPAKINDRFDRSVGATLDGTRFMDKAIYKDRGQEMPLVYDSLAMQWLEQHAPGSPVVAEVNTSPTLYGWGDRYAMFTGNPTVIGWSWHEQQQRPVDAVLIARRIAAGSPTPQPNHRLPTRSSTSMASTTSWSGCWSVPTSRQVSRSGKRDGTGSGTRCTKTPAS